jgi:hypothetical protein
MFKRQWVVRWYKRSRRTAEKLSLGTGERGLEVPKKSFRWPKRAKAALWADTTGMRTHVKSIRRFQMPLHLRVDATRELEASRRQKKAKSIARHITRFLLVLRNCRRRFRDIATEKKIV